MAVAALCLLSGCGDEQPSWPERLAVEAYINTDGFPQVILTTTLTPGDKPQALADHVVRWGRVRITDGVDTVTMVGGVDSNVFPPFCYRSFEMRGVTGRTYTIIAEYQGMRAVARSELLTPPRIVDCHVSEVNDTTRAVSVSFDQPDEDGPCYYVAYTRVAGHDTTYLPAYLGTLQANGAGVRRLAIFRGRTVLSSESYKPNFGVGEDVDIMIARVGATEYDFWQQFQQQVNFGNSIFVGSATSLRGNVNGGYGAFTARATATVRICL